MTKLNLHVHLRLRGGWEQAQGQGGTSEYRRFLVASVG
jgi:hypothetical protein